LAVDPSGVVFGGDATMAGGVGARVDEVARAEGEIDADDSEGVGVVAVQAARTSTTSRTDARANLGHRSDIVISLLLAISGVESRTS
jgi:hypothetical protein